MKISATVVADSVNEFGNRATTVVCTFPRYILAEVNTHRMISKNSASSRAIPFIKMAQAVEQNPFIPMAFQKNHPGMQGTEYCTERESEVAKSAWLVARNKALEQAYYLATKNVTKQLINRLLEPYMYHTAIMTATEWENFFALRCPQYTFGDKVFRSKSDAVQYFKGDAEKHHKTDWLRVNKGQSDIHMMSLAEAIWDARNESTPRQLKAGEWHIPFMNKIPSLIGCPDRATVATHGEFVPEYVKVSTAMCARTSYTVIGEEKEMTYEKLVGIHDKLIVQRPLHASPMEHPMQAMTHREYLTSFMTKNNEVIENGVCHNMRGFKTYRSMLLNENISQPLYNL